MIFKEKCYQKVDLEEKILAEEVPPSIDSSNLEDAIVKLRKGIIHNLDFKSKRLLKGDIAQYSSSTGILNVLNGAVGLGLIFSDLDKDTQTKFLNGVHKMKKIY